MTTAIRALQVLLRLIRWKKNADFGQCERETVFGFVYGSFTVGEVFACTLIFV